MFRKIFLSFLLVLCCVAYGNATNLQPLVVQLNWIPNAQFAGILLAKENGWYKDEGIDLTVKGWRFGISSVDEVLSGKAQVGVVEGDVLIRARADGKKLKAIGVQFQKSPFCLLSKKEKGIIRPEHLVGKRIGVNSPDSQMMLGFVLESVNIGVKDVHIVQAGWDLQPLIQDEIDVFTAFINHDPQIMNETGYKVSVIPAYRYGYDFYSGVYFTDENMIDNNGDLLYRFLKATSRGWNEAFENPDSAVRTVIEKYYPEGRTGQQIQALKVFEELATLGTGKGMTGIMNEKMWRKGINILLQYGYIDRKISAGDIFTPDILTGNYNK